jgi:hypothetical protein
MERKLFFWLNLHLLNEKQLFCLLCIIIIVNMLISLGYLWYKWYFVELGDLVILSIVFIYITYRLFLVEHLTFFSCLFYLHILLLVIIKIFTKYTYKIE